jgi:hypothetical protein
VRFSSLKHVPLETRRQLRDRLARNLPLSERVGGRPRKRCALNDESVLGLLTDLNVEFDNDEGTARAVCNALRAQTPAAPDFDDLADAGWFRVVWGRVRGSLDSNQLVRRASDVARTTLEPVLATQRTRRFLVGPAASADPSLASTIAEMQTSPESVYHLECPSPQWVMARLWERAPATASSVARLRFWVDRCDLLPDEYFSPSSAWDRASTDTFIAAALQVLKEHSSFLNWEAFRRHLVARAARESGQPPAAHEKYLRAVPATLVDRFRWLEEPIPGNFREHLDTHGDMWQLVNFLLCEVETAEMSAAPHPIARELMELGAVYPELLDFVTLRIRDRPILLADVLMDPRSCGLGCMLIAEWRSGGGAWDRQLVERDNHATRLVAFADAMAVMMHFVRDASVPPAELASLLSWLHEKAQRRPFRSREPDVDEQMLSIVRSELDHVSPDVLRATAEACIVVGAQGGLASSSFAVALELIAIGTLIETIRADPLVSGYLQSIRPGDYWLSHATISGPAARTLAQLAARAGADSWNEFLAPVDVRNLLAKAQEPDANSLMVADAAARTLRAHLRVLSGAIAAWEAAPPPELVDALVRTVRSCAVEHAEKGRIGAFAARYETDTDGLDDIRSIAADLGEALGALGDTPRATLLSALLESDEPLLLARLLTLAPESTRDAIRERIAELTPAAAADVRSLTEIQARIEALLTAGALDAAAGFIERERELKTWGKVPGRELVRLRTEMRLRLLRRDFPAILADTVPADLVGAESTEAQDILAFYQALAQFSMPGGDLDAAEATFRRLHTRRRDISAYLVNLLAVRASRILSGDLFGRLAPEAIGSARQALSEADAAFDRVGPLNSNEVALHCGNRALLLLAIGQPERAYEALEVVGASAIGDRIVAYQAVALSRMGRKDDALEKLVRAQRRYGETEAIQAARAQISQGAPFDARPVSTDVNDEIARVKAALFDLARMDPPRQAQILHASPDAFDALVIDTVRRTAASVVGLVPMMQGLKLDSCEDDLTALVQALLLPRLELLNWSVADQSRGGFTAKGNPGERDLVVKKDDVVLSVIEAVVCDRPATTLWSKGELTSHFQKVLGYATCRLFCHLTYSYVTDPASVLVELRRAAEAESPPGFAFKSLDDFPFTDSRPLGFISTYTSSQGDVKVAFILLDMRQQAQRAAARVASETNPRHSPGKSEADSGGS